MLLFPLNDFAIVIGNFELNNIRKRFSSPTFLSSFLTRFHGIRAMEVSSESFSAPTLTIFQCIALKLNELNYILWKVQFEKFLSSHMLLGFVTGGISCLSRTMNV